MTRKAKSRGCGGGGCIAALAYAQWCVDCHREYTGRVTRKAKPLNGEQIHALRAACYVPGRVVVANSSFRDREVFAATLHALHARGLVAPAATTFGVYGFTITDAGRAALADHITRVDRATVAACPCSTCKAGA